MDTTTPIAAASVLLGALLLGVLAYFGRKYVTLQQWTSAVDYAELVVNSIDKLYEDGQVAKDARLAAAALALTGRFPWLAREEVHTLIHGWLNVIRNEQLTITEGEIVPVPPLFPPAPPPLQAKPKVYGKL